MDLLISTQKELGKSIERGLINFKKCSKDKLSPTYITSKLEVLENNWARFQENHHQLFSRFPEEDLCRTSYVLNEVSEATEENFLMSKCYMKDTLEKITVKNLVLCDTASSKCKSVSGLASSLVQLPKISIPHFSGKYEEWTTFRDLFVSLVHKNTALDNVQKLHYLKAHLTCEAEQLIRHTPIASSNYTRCWELLENRYNNKRFLSKSILNRLFNQSALTVESASALKDLLDTSSDCLNALSCLGIPVTTWDIIVIHIVSSKLDRETRKQWELSVSSSDRDRNELPTFDQFRNFLENRFRALEFVEPEKPAYVHRSNKTKSVNKSFLTTTRRPTITKEQNPDIPKETYPCEFCSEIHKLTFCKKFAALDLNKRHEFVVKQRMCFNCLGGNHSVEYCRKPTSCRICRRRHHTLLHIPCDQSSLAKSNDLPQTASETTFPDPVVACLSTVTYAHHERSNEENVLSNKLRKEEPQCIQGNSQNIAISRLKSKESGLSKISYLRKQYNEVLHKYLDLHHMRPNENKKKDVYLPHYEVRIKDMRITTVKKKIIQEQGKVNKLLLRTGEYNWRK